MTTPADTATKPAHPTPPTYSLEELNSASNPRLVEASRELLLEYGQFVASHPSITSFSYSALTEEAAALPLSYLNQKGGAILAQNENQALGFIAWRSLPEPELASSWELKRLWVRPVARGTRLGRTLIEAVIERAKSAAITRLLLDTAPSVMPAAYNLYREIGFTECPSYRGKPLPGITYMNKRL
jgi:GNAT superfamily N-acetyltransferase